MFDWENRVWRRWAWFAKCSRMKTCHKQQFSSGTNSSTTAERVWTAVTLLKTDNIQCVRKMLNSDCRLSVRMVTDKISNDKMALYSIITADYFVFPKEKSSLKRHHRGTQRSVVKEAFTLRTLRNPPAMEHGAFWIVENHWQKCVDALQRCTLKTFEVL